MDYSQFYSGDASTMVGQAGSAAPEPECELLQPAPRDGGAAMHVSAITVSQSPLKGLGDSSAKRRPVKRDKGPKRVTLYRLEATLEDGVPTTAFPCQCEKRYSDFLHLQDQLQLAGCAEASTMGGGLPKKTLGGGRGEKTVASRVRQLQQWCDEAVRLYGDHGVLLEFMSSSTSAEIEPAAPAARKDWMLAAAFDVTISYAQRDRRTVRAIADRLRGEGRTVWVHPGERVGHEAEVRSAAAVASAIDGSRVVVCCMCGDYAEDPNCVAEYEYLLRQREACMAGGATRATPVFVPLITEEGFDERALGALARLLGKRTWHSMWPGADFDDGCSALASELHDLIANPGQREALTDDDPDDPTTLRRRADSGTRLLADSGSDASVTPRENSPRRVTFGFHISSTGTPAVSLEETAAPKPEPEPPAPLEDGARSLRMIVESGELVLTELRYTVRTHTMEELTLDLETRLGLTDVGFVAFVEEFQVRFRLFLCCFCAVFMLFLHCFVCFCAKTDELCFRSGAFLLIWTIYRTMRYCGSRVGLAHTSCRHLVRRWVALLRALGRRESSRYWWRQGRWWCRR